MVPEERELVSLATSRLLATVDRVGEEGGQVAREVLLGLQATLGKALLAAALDLVDREAVKLVEGRLSGRRVVQVQVTSTSTTTLRYSICFFPITVTEKLRLKDPTKLIFQLA